MVLSTAQLALSLLSFFDDVLFDLPFVWSTDMQKLWKRWRNDRGDTPASLARACDQHEVLRLMSTYTRTTFS